MFKTWTRMFAWLLLLFACGCTSVPPQVAMTHQREMDILESLEDAHLNMVDSYVDQKIELFDRFFFHEYGPAFRAQWIEDFEDAEGRPYDLDRDFPKLYNDLVAVYQLEVAPVEVARTELRNAIISEYQNAKMAHQAVARWLNSLDKLNDSEREAFDGLLDRIKPGLSLDVIDAAIMDAIERARFNLEELGLG